MHPRTIKTIMGSLVLLCMFFVSLGDATTVHRTPIEKTIPYLVLQNDFVGVATVEWVMDKGVEIILRQGWKGDESRTKYDRLLLRIDEDLVHNTKSGKTLLVHVDHDKRPDYAEPGFQGIWFVKYGDRFNSYKFLPYKELDYVRYVVSQLRSRGFIRDQAYWDSVDEFAAEMWVERARRLLDQEKAGAED